MKLRVDGLVLVAITALALPAASTNVFAEPVTIASVPVELGLLQPEFPASVQFYVTYGPTPAVLGPRILETAFTPQAIPQTVTATAGSSRDFLPFVDLLTNDRPEPIEFTYEPPFTRFGQSGALVLEDSSLSVDWALFTITSLSYTLNEFSFDTTRPFEVEGVVLFPVVLRGVFQVHGTSDVAPVPEPSSMFLLGIGAAGLMARWRRRVRTSMTVNVR